MSDLEVSVGEIADTSVYVRDAADGVAGMLGALASEVETATAQWSGLAAAAFDRAWREWSEAAQSITVALRESAGLLGEAGRGYTAADTGTADAVSRPLLQL